MKTLAALALIVFLGCSGSEPADQLVVDKLAVLKDGEARIFKLEPGSYKLELTASDEGASVEWVGADCSGSAQTNSYTTFCTFTRTGQLVINNPTGFGMGA